MSRGSCGHCPSGDLSMVPHPVTVAIQSRCMLLRRLSSLCLHAAGAYKRDAWAFTQLPFLKVPQDALSVGALDVPGHIYLIKTRQTLQFSLRAFLKVLALVPYQQSHAPAAQVWSQAQSTGSTADQRRRNTAIHNRPFGPATGASMPRGPHRAFATNGRLGTSSLASIKTVQRELTFVLWPFPMPNQRYTDVQYPDLYPIDPRLFGSEDATFFSILRQFRLLLTFKVSLAPDGTEDKELIFYAELNTAKPTYVTPIMPAGADSTTLNEWHAMRLLGFAWTTLMLGNKPKPGYRRKLSAASIPWYDFKIAALSTKQWSTLNDTVNPGAPKFGPLKGPLPGGSKTDIHMCFALHFQHALGEFGTDDPIACLDICPPGASFTATPSASSGSRVPSMESAAGGSRVPLFDSAATDSDQEEEQVRQAIALSMIQVSSSSSTTGDGPSRRPLPQRPTTNIRPRSQTISPPPSIRRRLNPTSIELRRSPSLVLVEAALPMYRTIRAWYLALDAKLSTIPFAITAPTTEAAVNALLQHIESFFGGEPYEADSGVDSVVIEPLGEYGPLTVDRSWKCFSNGSIGPGVGSNILTELINTVFSDPTAWKKTVRDTHVINITPAGIQPNHNRLRRLKAYVLEHALPPPISVFLAYALLAPKGEYDVILDETGIYGVLIYQVFDNCPTACRHPAPPIRMPPDAPTFLLVPPYASQYLRFAATTEQSPKEPWKLRPQPALSRPRLRLAMVLMDQALSREFTTLCPSRTTPVAIQASPRAGSVHLLPWLLAPLRRAVSQVCVLRVLRRRPPGGSAIRGFGGSGVRRFGGSEVRRFGGSQPPPNHLRNLSPSRISPSNLALKPPAPRLPRGCCRRLSELALGVPGPQPQPPNPATRPRRHLGVSRCFWPVSESQNLCARSFGDLGVRRFSLGDFGDSEVHSHSRTTSEALSASAFRGFLAFSCFDAAALRSLGDFGGSQPLMNLRGLWCLGVTMPRRFGASALLAVPESAVPQRLSISELQHFGASAFRRFGVSSFRSFGASEFHSLAAPNPPDIDPNPRGCPYAVFPGLLAFTLILRSSGRPFGLRGSTSGSRTPWASALHALYPRTASLGDTWARGFLTSFSKDSPLPSSKDSPLPSRLV
ncbi:hypothetical protein GGX14DRAFT_404939 [Mycena pura]|uniref:Uncharacterized protein n=1 Tax=Mycena pura TaxID=153505 RepID=A0AAD6Y4U2_9AGAR|nr:hypothetical protein GGX14DRAFT_404939 [Mycena pura]